ncbi:MAG: ankyrin repeat domain-containing protein [Armatimonadetes bacterium]|nr:ankyrin repeat domain-containing protein [Armatimonadota bacterium]
MGVTPDVKKMSPTAIKHLHRAARTGRDTIIAHYAEGGGDIDVAAPEGWTALMYAVACHQISVAELLLRLGANPEATGVLIGTTALSLAVYRGSFALIGLLLESGADTNHANNLGYIPLMIAAREREPAIARLLSHHGAVVNARDDEGRTALHFAAGYGFPETLSELMAQGADINAYASGGATPLMEAAWFGNFDKVQALIEAGATTSNTDGKGRTALSLALERGHVNIIAFLEGC